MAKNTLKIRLQEQQTIYKDSPGVTVTYGDLARLVGNLLEVIEDNEPIGFSAGKE